MAKRDMMQIATITGLLTLTSVLGVMTDQGEKRLQQIEAQQPVVLGVYYAQDMCIVHKETAECTNYEDVGFWLEIIKNEDGVRVVECDGAAPFNDMTFIIEKETADTIFTKSGVNIIKKRSGDGLEISFSSNDSVTVLSGQFKELS